MNTYRRHRWYWRVNCPKLITSAHDFKQTPPIPTDIHSQLPGATVEFFQPGLVEERLAECVSREASDHPASRPYRAPSVFAGRYFDRSGLAGGIPRGVTKKLQLHPTILTYSTPVMLWKEMGEGDWRRVVECVGLVQLPGSVCHFGYRHGYEELTCPSSFIGGQE